MNSTPPQVAVVGGGMAGLVAARRLAQAGCRVTLLEATDRLGGQVVTVNLAGRPLDVGAEAIHLVAPAVRALIAEIGLADSVVSARRGSSWLWTPRGRRRLPEGVGPAGPTKLLPVLRSRVLTLPGLLRAAAEPGLARLRGGIDLGPGTDVSVGEFVTGRFGRRVTQAFVDPLLGSLHSGDVDHLSLKACTPSLVGAATGGRSLAPIRPRRTPTAPTPPAGSTPDTGGLPPIFFATWPKGLTQVVDALLSRVDVDVRLGVRANALAREGDGYRLTLDDGSTLDVAGVVLATPAAATSSLLAGLAPTASRTIGQTRTANTATVLLGFDPAQVADLPALAGTGILVPSVTGSLLKAATHLSTKWPHLADPETFWVRCSAGRAGSDALDEMTDDELVEHLLSDLERFVGITARPRHVHVQRWRTGLPQLVVGHADRLAGARADLHAHAPGIALAGASYDGVGIAACLTSGERAAALVADAVTPGRP